VLLSGGCISISYAQPNKEQYELQERCGKQAAEVFKKEYGGSIINTKNGQIIMNYENHYSPKLNKCFFLEISVSYEQENDKKTSFKNMRLFDLNENKECGTFSMDKETYILLICDVQGKSCRTEIEWRQLVRPYMDE
jgi:hypothetical protein